MNRPSRTKTMSSKCKTAAKFHKLSALKELLIVVRKTQDMRIQPCVTVKAFLTKRSSCKEPRGEDEGETNRKKKWKEDKRKLAGMNFSDLRMCGGEIDEGYVNCDAPSSDPIIGPVIGKEN